MTRLRIVSVIGTIVLPLGLAVTLPVGVRMASAQDEGKDHSHDRPPHQPPAAAFEACQQKKSGDTCEVTFHEHTMSGTCATAPDERLFCRPDHPPGPPPELKAACAGKQAGDVCQATLPDRTITGTCGQGRHHEGRDAALICRPAQPSP